MNRERSLPERTTRKVLRKFLPLLGLCYFVLYMDRVNISVTALQFNTELGITPAVFGLISGVFFWTYSLLEIPSNYIVSRVGVRVWITRIVISWGVVTIATAFVQGATGLIVLRMLLGIAEAGFSPAMLFFVSLWIPRKYRAMALCLMLSAIPLSGISLPLIGHVMTGTDGLLGISGWRWVFILTGIPPLLLGYFFYRIIRNRPSEVDWLADDERQWLEAEYAEESADMKGRTPHSFGRGMFTGATLAMVLVIFLFAFCQWGYTFFIPLIIQGFGLGANAVSWFAALPSVIAIVPMLWWARHSDRTGERIKHYVAASVLSAVGFLLAAYFVSTDNLSLAITGFCIAGIGLFCCLGVQWSIPSMFLSGPALAAGLSTANGLGATGGYFGPQVVGLVRDASGSYALSIVVLAVAVLISGATVLVLGTRLKRRSETSQGVLDPATSA
ncbi:MFS transporter [Streptomyces sp. NPDC001393]